MTININDVKKWTIDIFSQKSTYFSVYAPPLEDIPTPKQGTKLPFLNNVFSILDKIQFTSKFQFFIEIKTNGMEQQVNVQTAEFAEKPTTTLAFETTVDVIQIDTTPIDNKIDCSIVMDSIKDVVFAKPSINDTTIQEYIQKRLLIRTIQEPVTLDGLKTFLNTEDPTFKNILDHPNDYTTADQIKDLIAHLTSHYAYSTNPDDVGKIRVGPFVRAIAKVYKKKTYIDVSFTKKGSTLTDIKAQIYYYNTKSETE